MKNSTASALLTGAALSLLCLSGCDQIDPLTRPYVWKATDINRHNIAAMAVHPSDLIQGRGTARHGAFEDVAAIDHINGGKPVVLPNPAAGSGGGGGS